MAIRRVLFALSFVGLSLLYGAIGNAAPTARAARAVRSASFDWDDNTVYMKTNVYLRSKTGGPERTISTGEYALEKHNIGTTGKHAGYELDLSPGGSFRDSSDHQGRNFFVRDLRKTIRAGGAWQGPSWDAFVRALSTPESARRTTIITARQQSSETLYEGLRFLQKEGYVRHVPSRANLFGVGKAGFTVGAKAPEGTTADKKVAVQRSLLSELTRRAARDHAAQAWTFSDDDWHNFSTSLRELSADVKSGKYPGVQIELRYTGVNDPAHAQQTVSL